MVNALEYLKGLPRTQLPPSVERGIKPPSNGDLRRWLNMRAIQINGETPKAFDEVSYPIWELIFFPKGKRRTTMVNDYHSAKEITAQKLTTERLK